MEVDLDDGGHRGVDQKVVVVAGARIEIEQLEARLCYCRIPYIWVECRNWS